MPPKSTTFLSTLRGLAQTQRAFPTRRQPFIQPLSSNAARPLLSTRSFHSSPFRFQEQSATEPKSITSTPPRRTTVPKPPPAPKPEYEMTFTCTPCSTRSTHRVSKQGYHHGSVLITCPECRNRHVISDHLNIFGDRDLTIEDLMRERGQLVKKGTLSEDGDVEFWEDGTSNVRAKAAKATPEIGEGEKA